MSSPSIESLTFGPRSTFLLNASPPQYGCHCHPMGNIERLPLLHAILDRTAGSFVGHVLTLDCQILISLSAILLPTALLRCIIPILECIDCMGFLIVCCIEVLLPSLNRLIWGDMGPLPAECPNPPTTRRVRPQRSYGSGTISSPGCSGQEKFANYSLHHQIHQSMQFTAPYHRPIHSNFESLFLEIGRRSKK